jgi:hypothetical protein
MQELATILKVHVRTVQTWHKEGLAPNQTHDRPLLFLGSVVREFLAKRRDKNRRKLKPDEFYCPRCHAPRFPREGSVAFQETGRQVGKTSRQIILRGICEVCSCRMRRFSTDSDCERLKSRAKLAMQYEGLKCEQLGFVFTDLAKEQCN